MSDYRLHEKCNRLQPITITNYDYPMSAQCGLMYGHNGQLPGGPTSKWTPC
jgi:hypothetical protein